MRVKNMETRTSALHRARARGAMTGLIARLSWLFAGSAMASTMESIEFSSLPGDKTEIRMKFDGAPHLWRARYEALLDERKLTSMESLG